MKNTLRNQIDLSVKKKLLLKQLLAKENATRCDTELEARPAVTPRPDRHSYPLSLTQRQSWKSAQLAPPEILLTSFRLEQVDLAALKQSVYRLAEHHAILRATFAWQDGQPMQTILPEIGVHIEEIDLFTLAPEEGMSKLENLLNPRQLVQFDLAHGPLFKTSLVHLVRGDALFIFALHPLLADQATLALLSHELLSLYTASVNGDAPALPDLGLTYADYAHWQEQYMQGPALKDVLHFWKEQLAGANLTLNLPLDYPRTARIPGHQRDITRSLDASLTEQVRAFCQREDLTLETCYFAVLALLMNRYTGQTDIVLGRSSTARPPGLEDVAGPFTTTQPIRVQLQSETTARTFCQQLQKTLMATEHSAGLPLESLVDALYPQHDLTREPVFQASFTFVQSPFAGLLSLQAVQDGQDLSFLVQQTQDQLALTVFYQYTLFTVSSIERLHDHFVQLLKALIAQPAAPLEMFSCLTQNERELLLYSWNQTTLAQPPDSTCGLHQLFEQQVARTPRAIALSDGLRQLTYVQLNERANQLAHLLRQRGVGQEQFVGLCLSRSFDLLIAQLAILKAGAAYVPLDPTYPRDRLKFTIQDAGLQVILTEQALVETMPFTSEQALCLDTPDLYSRESVTNLDIVLHQDQLAYVIYTSGSTGRPKGVCISHRNAVVFIHWARQEFSDEELAGVLFGTSICFDLSIFEVFAPLSWGGKVILAGNVLDLPHLAQLEKVTLLNTVPSAAAALLHLGELPASLLTINLAGEALARDLIQALYQHTSVRCVRNLYGPTEDTTYSTGAAMASDEQGAVTIGRPLVNTQAYIVDAAMQPVPIGVAGELYLGGDGQARGYLKRPDLTAERFVPDPFSRIPGSRLYKTGDLARYRADGNIDYLGRLDHQVKVRGFRIELGEIEAHLREYPALKDVVVVALDLAPGEKHLVAYVVAREQQTCDSAQLRQYLLERVPGYMVPTFFVILPALPQTLNGKVDRKALPVPRASTAGTGSSLPGEEETLSLNEADRQGKTPDGLLPLILTQKRSWFLEQLEPGTAQGILPLALALNGPLNSLALYQAMRELIRRHEMLRATIHVSKGSPFQSIGESSSPDFTVLDLTDHFASVNGQAIDLCHHPLVHSTLAQESQRPFNLARGPLLRVVLLRIASTQHVLLFNIHEVISDQRSLHILIEELSTLYTAFAAGYPSPLPALPARASSFAIWQREHQVKRFAADLAYWKEVFSPLPPALNIPCDYPRPVIRSSRGQTRRFHLSQELSHQLLVQSQQEGVPLFSALLTAFLVLLSCYGQQEDIVVGTSAANRLHPELSALVGCFANILALRVDLSENPTGRTLLHRVAELVQDALSHQAVPFDEVIKAVQPPPDPSRTPLFQASFLLQSAPGEALQFPEVQSQPVEVERSLSPFDLTFLLEEHTAGLQLHITYNTELFAEKTIERFQAHYQSLLALLCEQPETRLREIVLWPAEENASIYWTGTKAPWLEEGIGATRTEIRDVQIGIAQIEQVLREQVCVQEVVVLADESAVPPRLTAYIQATPEQRPDIPLLRLALKKRFASTLAITIHILDIFPLASDGTIDRPELGRLVHAVDEQGSPRQKLEYTLTRIWQNVLKLPLIERTENFFEIGGHSLLAMQLLAAIREELHVGISMRQFFTVPTIARLADLIEGETGEGGQPCDTDAFPPLIPVERAEDLPLSFAQQRLWFLDQLEGSSATYNIPVVLHLTGDLNIAVLQNSVREIVRRHEALRTSFPKGQFTPIQCISQIPLAPVELTDCSGQAEVGILPEIQAEIQRPFDLARGPLLRTRVLRLNSQEHIIIFVMHHIVSDGWSMAVLGKELNALYNAFLAGQPSPLPELTIQYGDFVLWQRKYLQGPRLANHLNYWRTQLADVPILALPTDHPRSIAYSAPGASCTIQWPLAFAEQLLTFSQQEDGTLFMLLLAGFQILLACYSERDDITVGTPVANRSHPALEPLVGFFVNTLALRTSLAGNPTVHEVLRRVREVTLEAYDHQDVPFEQVIEAVQPERQPGISPLFQAFFVLQNNATTELTLNNLQTRSLEMHTATAKFDLTVGLEMHDEGLALSIEYNTLLFEPSTIQQMQEDYRLLLEQCVAHPEMRLTKISDLLIRNRQERTGNLSC